MSDVNPWVGQPDVDPFEGAPAVFDAALESGIPVESSRHRPTSRILPNPYVVTATNTATVPIGVMYGGQSAVTVEEKASGLFLYVNGAQVGEVERGKLWLDRWPTGMLLSPAELRAIADHLDATGDGMRPASLNPYRQDAPPQATTPPLSDEQPPGDHPDTPRAPDGAGGRTWDLSPGAWAEPGPQIPPDHPRLPDAAETRRRLAMEPVCPCCSNGLPKGHGRPWGDDLCETCDAALADDVAAETTGGDQ